MTAIVNPKGPKPAKTYWLRRLVTLGIVVAVAAIVIMLIRAAMSEPPSAAPDSTTTPTPTVVSGGACSESVLQISTEMSARSYGPGEMPVIKVTVLNSSDAACIANVGDATRVLSITSGTDAIWNSAECPTGEASREVLLAPQGSDVIDVMWTRVRSAPGCPADLPTPGAGTYHVIAKIGETASEDTIFTLS